MRNTRNEPKKVNWLKVCIMLFMGAIFTQSAFATLETGLVDYWDFESLTGFNGNTLTNNGATKISSDYGSAYDFDGSNDYLISSISLIPTSSDFSFSFQMYYTKGLNPGNILISQYVPGASGRWFLRNYETGGYYIRDDTKGVNYDISNFNNEWINIVLSRSGNDWKYYANGVLIGSVSNSHNILSTPTKIGGDTGYNFFNGNIDELAFWSRTLSQSEITELYNNDGNPISQAQTPQVQATTQDYYNTSQITINMFNDWVSTSEINDDLEFSDFTNTGNSNENSGNIELIFLSETFTDLYNQNLLNLRVTSNTAQLGDIYFYKTDACYSNACFIVTDVSGYGDPINYATQTLNEVCEQLFDKPYLSHTTLQDTQRADAMYYYGFSGNDGIEYLTSSSTVRDMTHVKDITCGQGGYATTETLTKTYIATSNYDTFSLSDNKNLNGGSISAKLILNGIEYDPNSLPNGFNVLAGETITLKYYITGNGVTTPQLNNINFQMSNSNEIPQVEMFYNLNNQGRVSVGNHTNYNLDLTLSDNAHSIEFALVDENGETTLTKSFIVDTTKPVITSNIANEVNSYSFNTNNSLCSDSNLATCKIEINNQNLNLNDITSITSTLNGNISYLITAIDLAGNSETFNGITFINPKHQITFKDANNVILTDFTINNVNYNNKYEFYTYDFGLGNHTLSFLKDGFVTTEFNLVLTPTNKINKTISVPKASLSFELRDLNTKQLINKKINIELSGKSFAKTSTTNGTLKIVDNMLKGDYTVLLVDSTNRYESKELYFTFDGISAVKKVAYFLDLNSSDTGYIIIEGKDYDGSALKYKNIIAKQLDSEQQKYIQVQESKTDGGGKAEVKVLLEKAFYIFCIVDTENLCSEPARIKITENGKTIPLVRQTSLKVEKNIYNNVRLSLNKFDSNNTEFKLNTKVLISNPNQETGDLCFEINKRSELGVLTNYTPSCKSLDSFSFEKSYQFQDNNTYIWKVYVLQNGIKYPYFQKTLNSEVGFWELIKDVGLTWIFLIVLAMIGVASLFYVDSIPVVLLINVGIVISLWTWFNDVVSPESSSVIFVIILIAAWVLKE